MNKSIYLSQSYKDAWDDYKRSLSSPSFPTWDYIILTASNKHQADAFERQLRAREKYLPERTRYVVIPDKNGERVGSGGRHRGRKRLRYWLFLAAKSAVAHEEEFKVLHAYYTTRAENPLKKMQSLIAIAGKILRIIYTILKTGVKYDPEKMLKDIKRPQEAIAKVA